MVHGSSTPWHGRCELMLGPAALLRRGPRTFAVISLKTMLTVAAAGVVLSTPAFAQAGAAGGRPGGGRANGGRGGWDRRARRWHGHGRRRHGRHRRGARGWCPRHRAAAGHDGAGRWPDTIDAACDGRAVGSLGLAGAAAAAAVH